MSRSQGAANNGWPAQRHQAGEPDPRSGGRPAQRQQTQQPPQQQYTVPGQPAPGYSHQQGYPDRQAADSGIGSQQGYHYPQGQQAPSQPQYAPPVQQPSAAPQHAQYGRPSPVAPQTPQQVPASQQQQRAAVNRQGLSSLESARNAQPTHDFENFPRTQPPQYAPAQQAAPRTSPPTRQQQPVQPAAPQRQAYGTTVADNSIFPGAGYRQPQQPASQQLGPQFDTREPQVPSYDQWPPAQPIHDHYGQDLDSGYGAHEPTFSSPAGNQGYADPLEQADWAMPAAGYADPVLDEQGYGHYDQQHAGALEPTYNQDEAGAYEMEEPRRVSWTMRIAGAVVLAIGLGYGLAQAYKAVLGTPVDTAPPVIASDSSPAKERPTDPGGRQFSHTDSKVLGRLGENDSGHHADSGLYESDSSSDNGTKKVTTLVVGRDGSIAPPHAEPVNSASEPTVSVPGLMVVDAFGSGSGGPPPQRRMPDPEPVVVNTPPRPTVNVKSTKVIPATTASIDQEAAPAPRKQPQQRVAAAPPVSDEGATSASGANGYVVVLGSVPASGTSRLDALRKFADMQQQYGAVLANKTPDVRETVLAGKGPYHRLLVGPPGSRSQANELCIQLKASGYKDCWVTAY